MASHRPLLFLCASLEGLPIAKELQRSLAMDAECILWTQGVFNLESLTKLAPRLDYAILVVAPADLSRARAVAGGNRSRDNVLFELGLFAGRLGRSRTLLVYSRNMPLDLPPDLARLRSATFGEAGSLRTALEPIVSLVKGGLEGRTARLMRLAAMRGSGASRRTPTGPRQLAAAPPSPPKVDVRRLLDLARRTEGSSGEWLDPDLFEGLWRDEASDTSVVVRIVGGELRAPYAFRGATHRTGEFYGWKLGKGVLSGHFRWVNRRVEGRIVLRMVARNWLEGFWCFWWAGREVRPESIERIAQPIRLMRQRSPKELPAWSEEFFRTLEAQGVVRD